MDTTLLKESLRAWTDWNWRGRPGTRLLTWMWTLTVALGCTLFFSLAGLWNHGALLDAAAWQRVLLPNFVISLCVAGTVHLLYDLARLTVVTPRRVEEWSMWQRTLFFAGVPMLGVAIGWPLGVKLAGLDWNVSLLSPGGRANMLGALSLGLVITLVLHAWFSMRLRQSEAERRATEAQLRLLQGQIEPHFLFNTLATVQALMDADPPKAKRMLDAFTDYLRASLGSLRRERGTLGDELDLVGAYLELMQMRMEDRLRWQIQADIALRDVPLPPLALQPLVENAIHHGLEPKREGGTVRIAARRDGDLLVLEVLDDGLGLAAPPRRRKGAGVALANLRERLVALHGERAAVELADAAPGTRATLRLPLEKAAA